MSVNYEQTTPNPEQISLPQGWTELIHGTDSQRWSANDQIKHIVGSGGLSAVESQEVAHEAESLATLGIAGAYDTTLAYAMPRTVGAVPTEVRVIAPGQEFEPRRTRPEHLRGAYDSFSESEKSLLGNYYTSNARHPIVPRGENIIKIAEWHDETNGRKVIHYLPDNFADSYISALQKDGTSEDAVDALRGTVTEARKYIGAFQRETALQKNQIAAAGQRVASAKERRAATDPDQTAAVGLNTATLLGHQRNFERLMKESKLLRPSSSEDQAYRLKVLQELPDRIRESLPADSPLRFHATSLSATGDILQAGEISSSVDRTGQESSYDTAGQVSVATAHNVEISVDHHLGLVERNCCLPTGCLFVLMPKDAGETAAGEQQLMDNVYFRDNPEQLVGILTSDENLPSVRTWLAKAGLDQTRAQEFFAGVDYLKAAATAPYENTSK